MFSANIPNDIRKGIYRRDGYACALCGDNRHLQIHHVMPRSAGGGNTPMNLICLCRYCHANAHGLHLTELYIEPEEVEQACVEYVSDMYPGLRDPFMSFDYDEERDCRLAWKLIDLGRAVVHGEVWRPKWKGSTYDFDL